jgi:hypothetical protein
MPSARWNLVHASPLSSLPRNERYFEYADAYLDSADRLCKVLARSTRKANFQRGAVVLYLVQHALELFYKGAILRREPGEKLVHGVPALRARYLRLYPGKTFLVRPTFVPSYENLTKDEVEQVKGSEPPGDQVFRYPEDKTGTPWEGLFAFEASSFAQEISSLKSDFARVRAAIDA